MAKTVEEILRESGLTDEQIKALDAKVVAGVTQVLTNATQTLEQAELAKRAQEQTYANEVVPAINQWANEKAAYDIKLAAYEQAIKSAKEGGFQMPEIPLAPPAAATATAQPTRDATGKFVPGPTGSPVYVSREEGFAMVSNSQWYMTEYMRLHNGQVPPDDIGTLSNEAVANRMPFRQYVEKKYDFQAKREKIKADAQKAHDDAIRKEVSEQKDKEWAEKVGSNPDVRQGRSSEFSQVRKAVKDGTRPDPLNLSQSERVRATREAIRRDIAENSTVQ